ncbi:unnamed protein product, partial [Mesorhabditis spiculigera]
MADAEGFVQLCEGLQKKIIQEGQDTASPLIGSTVHVHYTGRLENGDVFDSSRTRDPFRFNLGREHVVKGWDIGVATMKKGERCELLIAPKLGYGPSGHPPIIPPGAILTFEVELIRWESEEFGPPMDMVKDELSVAAMQERVDEAECAGLLLPWLRLPYNVRGSHAMLSSPPKIPDDATLKNIKAAEEAKERGNDFLKQGKLKLALKEYQRIEVLLEHRHAKEAPSEKRDALMLAAFLNMATIHQMLNEEVETVAACDKALKMDPKNVKALYRKGHAKNSLALYDEAEAIFTDITLIQPNNKDAQLQIRLCKQRSKEFEQSGRRRYKRLFAKKSAAEPAAHESTSKEIDADDPQPCTSAEHEA